MSRRTTLIKLEIEIEHDEGADPIGLIDDVLDDGTFQDAIKERASDGDAGDVEINAVYTTGESEQVDEPDPADVVLAHLREMPDADEYALDPTVVRVLGPEAAKAVNDAGWEAQIRRLVAEGLSSKELIALLGAPACAADAPPRACANCGRLYAEHSEQTENDAGELCPDSGDANQRYADPGQEVQS